jgi:hypothetical protein
MATISVLHGIFNFNKIYMIILNLTRQENNRFCEQDLIKKYCYPWVRVFWGFTENLLEIPNETLASRNCRLLLCLLGIFARFPLWLPGLPCFARSRCSSRLTIPRCFLSRTRVYKEIPLKNTNSYGISGLGKATCFATFVEKGMN